MTVERFLSIALGVIIGRLIYELLIQPLIEKRKKERNDAE